MEVAEGVFKENAAVVSFEVIGGCGEVLCRLLYYF